jgi:hypothetical protein
MPVSPGVGYADMPVVVLDVGDDENFRVLGMAPLVVVSMLVAIIVSMSGLWDTR